MKTVVRFFMTTTVGVAAFASFALGNMHHHHGESMHHFNGELRTRYVWQDNINLGDTKWADRFDNRARVNLDFMPMDSMKVRIAPQAAHTWGDPAVAGDGVNVFLKEAWMAWMPGHTLSVYIGRQELTYGAGRFIGRQDWDQSGQHFDAARFRLNYDMGHTDIIWAKMVERHAGGDENDGNLFVAYTSLNLEDRVQFMRNFDIYAAYWLDTHDDNAETKQFNVGARAAGDLMVAFYDVELTGQFGDLNGASNTGLSGDLTVGMNFMDRHSAALNFVYANQHYRNHWGDTHQFLGDSDLIARQNVIALALKTSFGLTDEFNVDLDAHYFMQAKSDALNGGGRTTVDESAMGIEIDTRIGYQPNDLLRFEFGYALFAPQKALKDAGQDKTAHNAYLQGTMNF